MRARPLLLLVLAAAGAVGGCGPADQPGAAADPPSEGRILGDSVRALARLGEPSFRYELAVRVEAHLSEEAGLLGQIAGDPVELGVDGGFAPGVLVASGKLEVLGDEHEAELRAGPDALYLRFDDAWYGGPSDDFDTSFDGPAAGEAERLAAALEAAGNELVDGEASAGPDVDGTQTWQIAGTLDPDAAAAVARAAGERVPNGEVDAARNAIARARIKLAVGRADHLPRRIEVRLPIEREDLGALGEGVPVERIDLEVSADLTDWGRPVTFERPASARPFEELLGRFFLGLDGGAALRSAQPPVPGPPPQVEVPPPPQVEVPPPPAVSPPAPPG